MCQLIPAMHRSSWSAASDVSVPGHGAEQPRRNGLIAAKTEPQRRLRPTLVLGVFFLSLYLLTMGGHLDSPDEELMFQVTRSLVERGSMDIDRAAVPEQL